MKQAWTEMMGPVTKQFVAKKQQKNAISAINDFCK